LLRNVDGSLPLPLGEVVLKKLRKWVNLQFYGGNVPPMGTAKYVDMQVLVGWKIRAISTPTRPPLLSDPLPRFTGGGKLVKAAMERTFQDPETPGRPHCGPADALIHLTGDEVC